MPLYVGSTPVTIPGMGGAGGGLPTFKHGQTSVFNVVVTADVTPHTKGPWIELLASTAVATNLLTLYPAVGANGVATDTLVDVALGAAGAEVPIISNLAVGGLQSPWPLLLPVSVPAGSRVSIRTQCVTASKTSTWTLYLYDGVPASVASATGTLDVMTTFPATSRGVQMSSNLGWVEVVSATTKAYKTVTIVPSIPALFNPTNNSFIRIGSGAPGTEATLTELTTTTSNTESVWTGPTHASPMVAATAGPVPAGTRLCISTTATATNPFCACLIGVPA